MRAATNSRAWHIWLTLSSSTEHHYHTIDNRGETSPHLNTTLTLIAAVHRVELSDVNDQPPVLHLPTACVTVTEFHDPRDVITLVTADDADDVSTANGRVRFSIVAGNQDGERRGGKVLEAMGFEPECLFL